MTELTATRSTNPTTLVPSVTFTFGPAVLWQANPETVMELTAQYGVQCAEAYAYGSINMAAGRAGIAQVFSSEDILNAVERATPNAN